jgi:uncharacterized protein YdeI (YjbR/CyaY-like superfamily)
MTPTFFRTPATFRRWLERHHASETELWVGFYKVKSGKAGMVYREALDEALCYGWIDGLVRRVDEDSYAQRFTPRKKDSTWSLVNVRRVQELIAEERMAPAGLAAFERRTDGKTGIYSFEQRPAQLPAAYAARLTANPGAAAFFAAQPPGYRRLATWWVLSAKKEETRERRLATLIQDSAAGQRIRAARPARDDEERAARRITKP